MAGNVNVERRDFANAWILALDLFASVRWHRSSFMSVIRSVFTLNAWHVIKKRAHTHIHHHRPNRQITPHFTDLSFAFERKLQLTLLAFYSFTQIHYIESKRTSIWCVAKVHHKWFGKQSASTISTDGMNDSPWIKSHSNASMLWLRYLLWFFYRSAHFNSYPFVGVILLNVCYIFIECVFAQCFRFGGTLHHDRLPRFIYYIL